MLKEEYKKIIGGYKYSDEDSFVSYRPKIDVHVFEREYKGSIFNTLITDGMSSLAMRDTSDLCRAELIMYVDNIKREHFKMIRYVAGSPHIDNFSLRQNETVAYLSNWIDGSELIDFLATKSVIQGEKDFSHIEVDGDPLNIYWLVPITRKEREFKNMNGTNALLEKFEEKKEPFILNELRDSVV